MDNLYDLFKDKNGDHRLISLEELKSKLDFDKWYFTSTKLYNHYELYLNHTSYDYYSIIDIKVVFHTMALLSYSLDNIPQNYA